MSHLSNEPPDAQACSLGLLEKTRSPLTSKLDANHMKIEERYKRGNQLIEDAFFIKDLVMPMGCEAERWIVVVFEAYRVSELYIKALFFYSGYSPKETHQLDVIVNDLCAFLKKEKWKVPFLYSLVESSGDGYGIIFIGTSLQFFKRIANTYTELGVYEISEIPTGDLVNIKINVDGPHITVFLGKKAIIKTSNSFLKQSLKLHRTLVKPSDGECIDKLKRLVAELRDTREQAFYSERLFTKDEASIAIEKMNRIVELSKSFLVLERVD